MQMSQHYINWIPLKKEKTNSKKEDEEDKGHDEDEWDSNTADKSLHEKSPQNENQKQNREDSENRESGENNAKSGGQFTSSNVI